MFVSMVDFRASSKQYESVEPISALLTAKRRTNENVQYPRKVNISRNLLLQLPSDFILSLNDVVELDVSDNSLKSIGSGLSELPALKVVDFRGNGLHSLPDDFSRCPSLEELNIGDNSFETFPPALLDMPNLKKLYLATNRITRLPSEINKMTGLELLTLGDNRLASLPEQIAELSNLSLLMLSHNQLTSLPLAVCEMHSLVSLQLHNNCLEVLPPALLSMPRLQEISLRNNPLVSRFVREHVDEVPPLQELAARTIRNAGVPYSRRTLPSILVSYLDSSAQCDNPECRGVYFHVYYRQVKFVDFCGKYRIPFLHYLCSSRCNNNAVPGHSSAYSASSADDTGDEESDVARLKMRRVLLPEP